MYCILLAFGSNCCFYYLMFVPLWLTCAYDLMAWLPALIPTAVPEVVWLKRAEF